MKLAQGLIKFFALCLAAAIIVAMFAAVIGAFALVGRIVGIDVYGNDGDFTTIWQGDNSDAHTITKLVIKTGATNIKLAETEEANIQVDANSKYITTRQVGNTFYVEETSHFVWSGFMDNGSTVIYLPTAMKLHDVEISAGAGTFTADRISAANLNLSLGAGKTKIEQLNITENAQIDGGAGVIEIDNGEINNLNLELGAGQTRMKAELFGKNKVESGVGRLDLILVGGKDRYKFTVDKGIGSVVIDKKSQEDDAVFGGGDILIDLESGIGAVEVSFAE